MNNMNKMEIIKDSNLITVKLKNEIYVENASELREKLYPLIDEGNKNFLIDMEKLTYIDSSGLGVLIGIHKKLIEIEGTLIVKGLSNNVKNIFELTRLTKIFNIVD